MREQFERTAGKRLKDNVYALKLKWLEKKDPPRWIKSSVWQGLVEFWENEAHRKRSGNAVQNRNSDRGGYGPAKHTSGSMPYVRKRNKMVKFSIYFNKLKIK